MPLSTGNNHQVISASLSLQCDTFQVRVKICISYLHNLLRILHIKCIEISWFLTETFSSKFMDVLKTQCAMCMLNHCMEWNN